MIKKQKNQLMPSTKIPFELHNPTETEKALQRFYQYVNKDKSGCWFWTGGVEEKIDNDGITFDCVYFKDIILSPLTITTESYIHGECCICHKEKCCIHNEEKPCSFIDRYEGHTCHVWNCIAPDHVVYFSFKEVFQIWFDNFNEFNIMTILSEKYHIDPKEMEEIFESEKEEIDWELSLYLVHRKKGLTKDQYLKKYHKFEDDLNRVLAFYGLENI